MSGFLSSLLSLLFVLNVEQLSLLPCMPSIYMKTQDTSPLFAGIKIMRLMMILIVTLPRQRVWEHIVTLAKVEGVGNMLRQFLQRFPCYLRPSQNECNFIHIYTCYTLVPQRSYSHKFPDQGDDDHHNPLCGRGAGSEQGRLLEGGQAAGRGLTSGT